MISGKWGVESGERYNWEERECEKRIELWMVYIRLVAQIVTNNAKGLVRFFETQV